MFADQRTPGMAYPTDPRAAPAQTAPEEIGVMQRLDGVRSGAGEIEYALMAFRDRLAGSPANANSNAQPAQAGLAGALTDIEASIRESLSIIRQLSDAF